MLNGDGNEKNNKIIKKTHLLGSKLFVHFFAVVLHDYNAVLHD